MDRANIGHRAQNIGHRPNLGRPIMARFKTDLNAYRAPTKNRKIPGLYPSFLLFSD